MPRISDPGSISTNATLTICPGDTLNAPITNATTATLHANSSTATIEYEWQYSSVSTPSWTKIPNSTNTFTLSLDDVLNTFRIYEDIKIRRLAIATRGGAIDCYYSGQSPEITVNVVEPRDIQLNLDANNIYCTSEDINLSATGLVVGDLYEWRLNGTSISSPTSATNNNLSLAITSTLTVVGINVLELVVSPDSTQCSDTTTISFTIVNEPIISINSNSVVNTFCDNELVTITAIGTNPGASYQWRWGDNVSTTLIPEIQFNSRSLNSTETTVILSYLEGPNNCPSTTSLTLTKLGEVEGSDIISSTKTIYCNDERPNQITSSSTITSTNSSVSITYYWEATTNPTPDFSSNTVSITSNTATYTFTSALNTNTWYRRVSVFNLNGVECEYFSNAIQLTIQNIDGGNIIEDELYSCDINDAFYRISVVDNNFGPTTEYQWQSSTSNVSSTFTDITNNASSSFYDIEIASINQTTYYRRISRSSDPNTCSGVEYSNTFTFYFNSLDPGTITDYSGTYCFGSVLPVLGLSSQVSSNFDFDYQWYIAQSDDPDGSNLNWNAIPGETNHSYRPGTLDPISNNSYIFYRRGVTLNDGSLDPCERYTNVIRITIQEGLDVGYVDILGGTPDFPYCAGETFPDLFLISADPNIDNNLYNLTATWQLYDVPSASWRNITDGNNNSYNFDANFGDSDNPSDLLYLDESKLVRVRITETN
ncbi:hypothetical protein EB151_05760, partial [archaeon]|nr:hypothetical protein [archaeon]